MFVLSFAPQPRSELFLHFLDPSTQRWDGNIQGKCGASKMTGFSHRQEHLKVLASTNLCLT